jgi:hypothetical protein
LKNFFWGASPGSFKKPTQIPNAGHPISAIIKKGFLLAPKLETLWGTLYKLAARICWATQAITLLLLPRHWKDHFKSDLRSDQDHHLKKDLRSDQDQKNLKNDLDLKSRSKIIF